MQVRKFMTAPVIHISPEASLMATTELFLENKIDGAPVVDDKGCIVGLVTKTHLLRSMVNQIHPSTPVKSIMAKQVVMVSPHDDIRKIDIMYHGRYPVMDGDKLVGFITKSDIMIALYEIIDDMSGQLETVIQSAYNPIIAVDREGIIGIWNQAAEKMTGFQCRDVIGTCIHDVIPESELLKIVQTGQSEFGIRIKIGNIDAITNRAPVVKNGKIAGAVAVLYDISDLEQISQELEYVKQLNYEMDAIIESSFDGLYITDGNALTVRINKAIKRITGLGEEELLYKTMHELVETGILSRSATITVMEDKEPLTTILNTITGVQLLVSATPVFDANGDLFRVVTNVRDMSELNALKQRIDQLEGLKNHFEFQIKQLTEKLSNRLIYAGPPMENIIYQAIKVAEVDSTVLISGESGVGKELIAQIIHEHSKRHHGQFVKLNCAAIPENLLESELFGYETGAFTGARKDGKPGLFEVANSGTLLLDEIGDLPLHLQVKLLRVLQEREIIRVGGTSSIPVDVRIIAITNRHLPTMIRKGEFREDLYYRLNVVPIHVPPLRERKADIPLLIHHFINKYNQRYHLTKSIEPEVVDLLAHYDWPGNIRQLENLVERMVVTCPDDIIHRRHIPFSLFSSHEYEELSQGAIILKQILPLRAAVETIEQMLIQKALDTTGSCNKVADLLEVNPSTISRKARKYGITMQANTNMGT